MQHHLPHISTNPFLQMYQALSHADHKRIRALQKRSEREQQRLCLLEGEHLCTEYLYYREHHPLATIEIHSLVVMNDNRNNDDRNNDDTNNDAQDTISPHISALVHNLAGYGTPIFSTSAQKFALLCNTTTPQGVLAVIDLPERPFAETEPLLVLDGVADPGNVGTIIRTADWFGVRNILLGQGCADRFHPKTLRATMGSVFRCAIHSTPDLATTLQTSFAGYTLWGASLQGLQTLEELGNSTTQCNGKYGIVMGSEAHGISPAVQDCLTGTFKIHGGKSGTESLNVAVAAGIILHKMSANVERC
jgi:RNA methyltransferase, TrmH family